MIVEGEPDEGAVEGSGSRQPGRGASDQGVIPYLARRNFCRDLMEGDAVAG
jgi:hypothetical protein